MNAAECVKSIRMASTAEDCQKAIGWARFLLCESVCRARPAMCSELVAAGIVDALAALLKSATQTSKDAVGVLVALIRSGADFEKGDIAEAARGHHSCAKLSSSCEVCWVLENLKLST